MFCRHALSIVGFLLLCFSVAPLQAQQPEATLPAESDEEIIARVDRLAKWPTPPTLVKIREFPNALSTATTGMLTPNGKYLLIAGHMKMGVWNVETGVQIADLDPDQTSSPDDVALSDDGKWALFGTSRGVALLNVETEELVRTYKNLKTRISSMVFSPDDKQIYVCDVEGCVMIVDLEKPDAEPTMIAKPMEGISRSALAILSNGNKLFLYEQNKELHFEFTEPGGEPKFLSKPADTFCRIIPANDRFLVPGYDRHVSVYMNAEGNVQFHTIYSDDWLRDARFTSDQKSFWLVGGHSLSFHDTLTPYYRRILKLPQEAVPWNRTVIAPDKRLVVAFNKDLIRVWKVDGELFEASKNIGLVVNTLIVQERFELLNQIGDQWAQRTDMFQRGHGDTPYSWLCGCVQDDARPGSKLSEKIEFFESYLKDHPDNSLMRIALFHAYNRLAFQLRGEGFANTVTEEGWKGFSDNMQKAWATLLPVLQQEKFPPEVLVCGVLLARNTQQDKAFVDQIIGRALQECPRYSRIFCEESFARLPRWGGNIDDAEKLAANVANTIGGEDGDMAYAKVFNHLLNAVRWEDLFNQYGFDSDRIMKGYLRWNEVSRDSEVANAALAFASRTKDGDAALEIFKRFEERGDIPSYKYWGQQYVSFYKFPEWALLHTKPDENPFSLPSSDEEP